MQGEAQHQYLVSYVVNDSVAIDAGSVGFGLSLPAQRRITDVILSHCHLDHVASLPIFLDNVYQHGPQCVNVHGSDQTLAVLQQDMFNDRIWPDFVSLSTPASPFLKLNSIFGLVPVTIGKLRITPLPLVHIVPTYGFVIEDESSAVAIVSDTYHGSSVWPYLAKVPNLRAVLLECSFPDQLDWLADRALHLTPCSFAAEARYVPPSVRVVAIHIKPAWYDPVVAELQALGLPNLEIGQVGVEYHF